MKPRTEIPFKEWIHDEAARLNLNPITLYRRIVRGKHAAPAIRKKNRRVLFVIL